MDYDFVNFLFVNFKPVKPNFNLNLNYDEVSTAYRVSAFRGVFS